MRKSEDHNIPRDTARKLAIIRNQTLPPNGITFLEDCGLYSSHINNAYYDFDGSYLHIKDRRKWMLAKIKYGI